MKAEINPGSRGLKHSKMNLLSWLTWNSIPSKHHKKTECWCYTSYKSADIIPNLGIKIRSWIKAKAWKPFDLITNLSSFCFQYKSTTRPTPISSQSIFKQKNINKITNPKNDQVDCQLIVASGFVIVSTDEFRAKVQEPHPFWIFGPSRTSGPPFPSPQNFGEIESCRELENHGSVENNGPVFSPQKSAAKFGKLPICEIQVDLWSPFKAGDPNSCGLKPLLMIQKMKFESGSPSHIAYVNANIQRR